MTTKQDKKPVPFIKAGELIEKGNVYFTKNHKFDALSTACSELAISLYKKQLFSAKDKSVSIEVIDKYRKLAKRLEREFLRKDDESANSSLIKWQPINTIPVNERIFLLCDGHIRYNGSCIFTGRASLDGEFLIILDHKSDKYIALIDEFTHWAKYNEKIFEIINLVITGKN